MDISKYISADIISFMRDEIRDAGGNEVFFLCKIDEDGKIIDCKVGARGNIDKVGVITEVMRDFDVMVHNHPSGDTTPSDQDIMVATNAGYEGRGFYIVDNNLEDIYIVVEPFIKERYIPIDAESIINLIKPDGSVAKLIANYERREVQEELIGHIVDVFNNKGNAIIEAPTGVGKSIAYLLPAIYWATTNKEKVIISTNTINLQEQLIKKDIPLLKKALDIDFEAVLVKGRGNYVCKRKIYSDVREALFDDVDKNELKELKKWAKKSKEGDKSELTIPPTPQVWERVASDSESCIAMRCPYYKECFFYNARRKMAKADILITNHYLLFTDIACKFGRAGSGGQAVLIPYNRVIIDEAHNIEEVATIELSRVASLHAIKRAMRRIYNPETKRGLIVNLINELKKYKKEKKKKYTEILKEINSMMEEGIPYIDTNLSSLIDAILKKMGNEYIRVIRKAINKNTFNKDMILYLTNTAVYMQKFSNRIVDIAFELYYDSEKVENDEVFAYGKELHAKAEKLYLMSGVLNDSVNYLKEGMDIDNIYWFSCESNKSGFDITIYISPMDVGELLQETIFEMVDTSILISATLTIDDKFDFIIKRLGFRGDNVITHKLPYIFDYENNAMLVIPQDIPIPNKRGELIDISEFILKAINITEGRALVLFTSYKLLTAMYDRLKDRCNYDMLRQGNMNRHILLDRFKGDTSSVLFATSSFWEGIDVPGEALINLILTKLPFPVPDEPIIEARMNKLQMQGENAFMSYYLPIAVLKFKQGFGRLIRHRDDKGVIFVFDTRIIKKSYGRVFISSLPPVRIITADMDEIEDKIKDLWK